MNGTNQLNQRMNFGMKAIEPQWRNEWSWVVFVEWNAKRASAVSSSTTPAINHSMAVDCGIVEGVGWLPSFFLPQRKNFSFAEWISGGESKQNNLSFLFHSFMRMKEMEIGLLSFNYSSPAAAIPSNKPIESLFDWIWLCFFSLFLLWFGWAINKEDNQL